MRISILWSLACCLTGATGIKIMKMIFFFFFLCASFISAWFLWFFYWNLFIIYEPFFDCDLAEQKKTNEICFLISLQRTRIYTYSQRDRSQRRSENREQHSQITRSSSWKSGFYIRNICRQRIETKLLAH